MLTKFTIPKTVHKPCQQYAHQAGYATLGIGVFLMIMLSLMTVYLSKSGILDLRTSADKARYAEALATAEQRLDIGLAWLNAVSNSTNAANDLDSLNTSAWSQCTDGSITGNLPGAATTAAWSATFGDTNGDGTGDWLCRCYAATLTGTPPTTPSTASATCSPNTVYLATPASDPGSIFIAVAGGQSVDTTANAIVKQGVYFFNAVFPGAPGGPPPLMGAGNIPLNGTFNVVANPNGGGPGVPVSVWSKSVISDPQGSAKTCHAQDYVGGDCTNPLSKKDVKGVDIVDGDTTNYPPDMFQYVFGVPKENYTVIKSRATVLGGCGTLGPTSSGIYWITGECIIPANTTVGSVASPVIIIVQSADFRMNANSTLYGIVFAFDPNENAGTMTMNGGAAVHGALLSNDAASMGININGTFSMIYDMSVMAPIIDPDSNFLKMMSRTPGSWADFL